MTPTLRTLSVLALAAATACGPKATAPVVIPVLPGDGDTNTAKPPEPPPTPAATDPWATRADLIATPPAQAPAPLDLPPIERFTLANGLQVFVIKSARLPVVSMQLAVKAGRADERLDQLGVAAFSAAMLTKGTKKRDALAIAQAIDFVGGSLDAAASFEATLVTCSAMTRDAATCLSLLPEVVATPTFPEAELPRVREAQLAEVAQRLDDAGAMAGTHFQNLLWGDAHVRGWAASQASVLAVDRADLVAWHKTWFSPTNAMLAVAGDVDVAKLRKDLEKAFAGWKPAPTPARPTYAEPLLDRVRVRLVDKPGQTQAHIRIGHFGLAHTDPRFFESLVWNYALGGGAFSSRLMKVVRSEGGKTYGATSTFDRNLDRGSFVAATFTRSAETVATVKLILGELEKMQKSGPTEAEVADAIANLAGSYSVRYESASDVAGALLAAELHGFGEEYLENYAVRVGAVDVAAARQAAAEVLDPNRFVIVLVGDAAALEPQLEKAGWRWEKVSFREPIGPQPTVEVTPEQERQARALLDAALAAKGSKLASVKSMTMVAKGTLGAQGQQLDVTISRTYVAPDKMRVELVVSLPGMGSQTIVYALDGKVGWQQTPQGIVDIPADQVGALIEQRWHDPEFVLLRHKEAGTKVTPLGAQKVGDVECDVVNVLSADKASTATLFVDRKTKLLVQVAYPENGKVTLDTLSDFKLVDGLQIAHTRRSQSGDETIALTIAKVAIDPPVDASVFARPAGP